jgi:hypothetical protein
MKVAQIFTESFEPLWTEFDGKFRDRFLTRVQELGSLYRPTLSRLELSQQIGRRFYEALEQTLIEGGILQQFQAAMRQELPGSFDEVELIFSAHEEGPLHAFMMLMIYIREYPFRAFFSGRDEPLPFNTLTVRLVQSPGDALPRAVGYGLSNSALEHCPWNKRSSQMQTIGEDAPEAKEHPKNHWFWQEGDDRDPPIYIWVWHF